VGEPTLGELLGADAVIFSTLANDGTLSSWAVDTSKRTTLAKSVPVQGKIPTVEYPPMPQRESGTAAWIEEIKEIARANPTAPFAPKPVYQIGVISLRDYFSLNKKWEEAKKEVRPIKELTLFQITGGTNNEAETIQSFLANNNWIQNNYTVYDRSGDTEYGQYAGSFVGLTFAESLVLGSTTDILLTGSVQQVGRKNMMILNFLYSEGSADMKLLSFEYADSLELWVKLQWAVESIIKSNRRGKGGRKSYIYSQYGTGVNRAEAERMTQLLISDTLSITLDGFAVVEFIDATRETEKRKLYEDDSFVNINWSRSGNRTRLDVTTEGYNNLNTVRNNKPRYTMEYGSQQEFIRKMRGLSVFVIASLGSQIRGLEGYDLSTAPDPSRVSANFTKLTRVITQQGTPMGGFYIANAPVTQREYEAVLRKNPSVVKNPSQPVNNVSIIDAFVFCNQMSIRDGLEPAYLIEGSDTVTVDNFASSYRLATTDEWNYARDKIEGMGDLAEYVYDGKWEEVGSVARRTTTGAKILANGWNGEIHYNEGSTESNVSAPYEPKSYEQDLGEGTGPIANTRRIRRTAVIRLVRPILDYWKYTSGQEVGSFYLGR
jgi:hypothetical protein